MRKALQSEQARLVLFIQDDQGPILRLLYSADRMHLEHRDRTFFSIQTGSKQDGDQCAGDSKA
jgi:hypothetical protein